MQANYTKQNLIVIAVVAGALAGVIGFGMGALLTRPERTKLHTRIADIKTQLDYSKAELSGKLVQVNQLITANDKLRIELRIKVAEINELKFANERIRAELAAEISKSKAVQPEKRIAKPKPSFSSPDVGEQGYLQGEYLFGPENPKHIPVAISKKILDSYVDAVISNDITGVSNLYLTGEIFPVADGTKILRLSPEGSMWSNLYKRKVRILTGEYAGKIAWVGSSLVTK